MQYIDDYMWLRCEIQAFNRCNCESKRFFRENFKCVIQNLWQNQPKHTDTHTMKIEMNEPKKTKKKKNEMHAGSQQKMKNQMNWIEPNRATKHEIAKRRNRTIYEIFSSLQIFAFVCEFINSRIALRAPFCIFIRTCRRKKREKHTAITAKENELQKSSELGLQSINARDLFWNGKPFVWQ